MTKHVTVRFDETALSIARKKSASLRTTMLAFVGGKLGLKQGDEICWIQDGGTMVRVDKWSARDRDRNRNRGKYRHMHTSQIVQAGLSLRTTIPKEIVKLLNLAESDILVWDLDKECKGEDAGKWFAVVKKRRGMAKRGIGRVRNW